MAVTVPRLRQSSTLPYRDWVSYMRRSWRQGEHMTLIGPTGAGKTTLLSRLLELRDYVVVFATKSRDDTMSGLFVRRGYKLQRKLDTQFWDRIVLWPDGKSERDTVTAQTIEFDAAIDELYRQTGWTLALDEVAYLSDFLGMQRKLRWLLQQGRSSGITVVACTQRPAFIPLAFYDQASWLIFWSDNDSTNLKRIQGIGGEDGRLIRGEVMGLEHRQILCVHNRYPYERFKVRIIAN